MREGEVAPFKGLDVAQHLVFGVIPVEDGMGQVFATCAAEPRERRPRTRAARSSSDAFERRAGEDLDEILNILDPVVSSRVTARPVFTRRRLILPLRRALHDAVRLARGDLDRERVEEVVVEEGEARPPQARGEKAGETMHAGRDLA